MERSSARPETGQSDGAPPSPNQAVGNVPEPDSRRTARAVAWGIFGLLFLMHLLDSVDRWLLAAVLPEVRAELELSQMQAEWLSTVLLLGFAVGCPAIGYLADRLRRPRMLSIGFAIWSLATVATGLARTDLELQTARGVAGLGGATLGVVALTLVMDLFPRTIRGRMLAGYYLAMPAGAALAMSLGVAFARITSWQTAFLAVGAPGLLLALVALIFPEPVRGASDEGAGVDIERLKVHERVGPSREDYVDLMVNSSFTYSVFGMAFASFALAGLVYWSPTFLKEVKGFTVSQADLPLGLGFLAAAIIGTSAGGWLADRNVRRRPQMLFLVPGLAILAAIPATLAVVYGHGMSFILGSVVVSLFLMFLTIGPCYAIIANVVAPNMRGVACGVTLSAVHLLGDLWSPTLMGWVVDTFGQADSMATGFGQALAAVNAVPVIHPGRDPENFTAGMLVVVPALLISGIVLVAGSRHLPREMALMLAKLRAAPTRTARGQARSSHRSD